MLGLVELAKRLHNDALLFIAEVLTEDRPLLGDAIFKEANNQLEHVGIIRSNLPRAEVRKINEGVGKGQSDVTEIRDKVACFQTYSEIDVKLAKLAPNESKFLTDEERAFVDGLGEQAEEIMLYGNIATDTVDGFFTRLNATALDNVTSMGHSGTGAVLDSLLIVDWHNTDCHALYPRNAEKSLGIDRKYLGIQTVKDVADKQFEAHRTLYEFNTGLHIKDPKRVHRICNINKASAFKPEILLGALNQMKNMGKNAVIYCSTDMKTVFDVMAYDKAHTQFTVKDVAGLDITHFRGVPIKVLHTMVKETAVA